MRKRYRLLRTLGVAAAVGSMVAVGGFAAQGSTTPDPGSKSGTPASADTKGTSVTLITGDRVVLNAGGKGQSVDPGAGREDIGFFVQRYDGHVYVIPSDARKLLADGTLDRRLFDVTGLVAQDYQDGERQDVPLIVSYGQSGDRSSLSAAGLDVTRDLSAIDGAATEVAKADASDSWSALKAEARSGGVERIWLDGQRETQLDKSVPQIGAPDAWEAGYTGEGVLVAVLDTGIDAEHPDLAGQVADAKDFSGEGPGDKFGHGTHVASTIAGTAAASDGKYKGVAPDAQLLDGKVCDGSGSCTESAILDGMTWAAETKQADVINLSLGGTDTPQIDPLEEAVNTLTEQTGALFVIAAGNSGPDAETVSSPGSADSALAVGAVTKKDNLAFFSSRGPRIGDGGLKPDITAPGVAIAAAKAKGTEMGPPVGTHYTRASGTSMATPHVVGAAALLAQQHPDWEAGELKPTLMASAEPNPDLGVFEQGAGRVNLTQAIEQTVVSDPASLSFGLQSWPHDDDKPVSETVTYQNNGDEDVTLDLTAGATGPDGTPAPDGMFTLSKDSITVPAGGTASVDVTADTTVESVDGGFGGYVSASAGSELVARTPIGVNKEVESYDITVKTIGTDGEPETDAFSFLFGLDEYKWVDLSGANAKVRLPKGDYLLQNDVYEGNGFLSSVQPTVTLDKDTTITVDAADTEPMSTTVPNPDAKPALIDVGYQRTAKNSLGSSFWIDSFDQIRTQQLGPDGPVDGMTGTVASQWGKPNANGRFVNSPFTYALTDVVPGEFPVGYERDVKDSELGMVEVDRNAQVADRQAYVYQFGFPEGVNWASAAGFVYDLPSTSTHYVDGGIAWDMSHDEFVLDADGFPLTQTTLASPPKKYEAGKVYHGLWNAAVFGPATSKAYAQRLADSILVDVPMYSDAEGHPGYSLTKSAKSVLLRDGKEVATSEYDGYVEAEVQPGEATYELKSTADRTGVSDFSTKTEASWTFKSDTAGGNGAVLPLWSARFAPEVDEHNVSHEGPVAQVPVTVEAPKGAEVGEVTDLTVEVSTDDGETWEAAELTSDGENRWIAEVKTPADAKFVSLHTMVTDKLGNTAHATILRAYGLAN